MAKAGLFLSIVGSRSGIVPEGGDGRSIVEMQFDAATNAGLRRVV